MGNGKKSARGIEEVSHFFLSRQRPSDKPKKPAIKKFQADVGEITTLPDDTTRKKEAEKTIPTAKVNQNLCLLLYSNSLFAEKSFLACNLALELARKSFSVGLIETTAELPNTFFLMGSLSPESTDTESAYSLTGRLPAASPLLRVPETLKLMDISIGDRKKIKAVFWDRDFGSADCHSILNRLSREYHFLIINAPHDIFKIKKIISFMNPFLIVSVTVNSEELLRAYLLIKQLCEDAGCREAGILIMEESLVHKAEAAFNVIAEMARKSLSINLHFMGTIPRGTDLTRPILTRTPLLLEAGNSPVFQSIRKLADSVIKNTSV